MLFNRQGLQQKNWRMVKKGKHILFGCSLFFVVGGMSISGSQVTYAGDVNGSEIVVKQEKNSNIGEENPHTVMPTLEKEKQTQNPSNKMVEKITTNEIVGSPIDKKEVNKKELKDLVDKIKKTDISKKTEKSAEKLNLILSRAEKALENKEITQEEIDKEVKALKEAFDKLEDKPKEDKKSEDTEKAEFKEEKSNVEKNIKEKQQENSTEDVARKHNEKITKVTTTVNEIHSIANQINYEFSDAEKELVETADKLPTTNNSEESIQKLLNEVIYLRNKVANRMTREHSGKRDARNGKMIENGGESTFRGIRFTPLENVQNGKVVSNADTNLTYFNSDNFWVKIQVKGEKFRHDSANTFYLVKKVTLSGKPFKDLSIIVSSGRGDLQAATTIDNINNPNVQAGILGNIGSNGIIKPGNYQVILTVNDTVSPANNYNIIYNITIKPQSERNTVRDLTLTYVDDVRHLTEAERTALIEKFKAEHPDVVNRAHHIDFERAEVSEDGTTMTIHFKDGFNPKTIQTNATNDVEAKHSSLTAYFGDSKELYTNPRELVRSKTGNEVPTTAQVTYKTPFNLQQVGTRNVVVTTTYENGVTKDVTTPYTVLDFIGKQDKKINQNQSGQLGDARNYITVSDNSALPGELTVRWKGGSSTVDTSAAGVQHKEIEILRGNHLMKTVTIPVEIVDNINPTITAPDSVLLTRLEGLPSEINISAQDNNKGVGLKDGNPITVENLPNPLFYNPRTSKIEISGVIPNNFQNGRSSLQVTVKAVDRKGNTTTKNITFNIQSQTQKYTAAANPKIQEVSHAQTPDPGTSINTTGLPANTQYKWERKPDTNTPGNKEGIVKVTYPDGSIDTVTVTVKVRKLSDEHEPTATKIVKNQNDTVSNNDLKAVVTINNNGNGKVRSVTPVGNISTTNAGTQTINATVTYLDGTIDSVSIPLEVKDITAPTIQIPTEGQLWEITSLDRILPQIKVTSVDNSGGTGVKSTNVTGLPDFLVYDNATKTIKFKNGVQEVSKLPAGQDSKTYDVNIQVTDNSNNSSQRRVTITVKSMTTKYNATPNGQKQTVSYGEAPDAGTSINKNGLPAGTSYTWRTTPNTTTGPGQKAGVVIVMYPDGSIDLVNVTVNVRKLSEEYEPTASKIDKNQNESITNDELKAAVTIGNNGNNKVKSVTPVGTISTAEYGNKTINAIVTYLDDTTDTVTIPLKVKDVTKPTIQTPVENTNWEMTALDKTLPNMEIRVEDNENGSGIKTVSVTGLPDYLEYDSATNTIKFKTGKQEVEKLPENTPSKEFTLNIRAEDNAGNVSERTAKITVSSMSEKYNPVGKPQTVDNGTVPNAEDSVDKTDLPEGTTVTWKTNPDVSTPGSHPTVALVHYPDGTVDEVTVPITVKEQKDTYTPTAKQPGQTAKHGSEPSAEGSINTDGLPSGTTYKWVEKPDTNTTPGNKPGKVLITYPDNSTEEVTVTVEVTPQKDDYDPQPKAQTVDNGTVPNAEDSVDKTGLPEGTRVTWKTNPDVSTPGSHPTVALVTYPDGTVDEVTVPITVKEQKDTYTPTAKQPGQTAKHGSEPSAEGSINTDGLPSGTTYKWVEKPDTNTTPGNKSGKVLITYPDNSTEEVTVTVEVTPQKDDYDPQPKAQTADNGIVPNAEDSVNKTGLPEGTRVTWKTNPDVSTPGSHPTVALVTYPDGTVDEVTVPITVKEQKDTYTPTAKQPGQTAKHGSEPSAEGSINTEGLPKGTTYTWVEKPDTNTTPGNKPGKVLITYPDNSTEEVTVTVEVTPQKDDYDPQPKAQTVDNGTVPNAEDSVNKTGLPEGTRVTWKKNPDVSTPGSHPTVALVTYPDGTVDEVTVPITVKEQKDTYTPTAKQPGQTAKHGSDPSAEGSINTDGLPSGTTYKWVEKPDTNTTPGNKSGKVLITYPDNSTEEVTVTVEVTPQKDDYDPQPKAQTVDNGTVPNAEDSVDKTGLPSGTTIAWKETPVVNTPGSHPTVALVTYPDGTVDEVTVPITVKEQKDTYTPTAKQPGQTAKHGSEPSAEGSINTDGLPSGTTYKWVEKPDTNTTPGNKSGKVLITYPDNSTEEVTVTVEVTPQKDDYDPQPKAQTVDNGTVPNAEDSVNKTGLPSGTTIAWKETPVVNTPGEHPTVALVTYPDGTVDEVTVPITVKEQKDTYTPTAKQPGQTAKHGSEPSAEGSINTEGLPKGTTYTWVEKPDTNTTPGNKPGKVLITYPDNSTEEVTVTVEVTPQKDDYDPQPKAQTVDNGTVPNAEDSVDKTGLPSGTTIAWKETPVVNTPGSHPTVALVTYPDGTVDEVTVPITVKEQKDTYTPTAKQPGQTAKHGSEPSAEGSINTDGLPSGTTYKWVEKPDTNTTPGNKPGKVLITYPDNSTEEVTVTVEVTPQKDDYDPQPKAQTITNGDIPNAKDSIGNVKELPDGTKIEWKDRVVPSTNIPENVTAKITITYPDGTEDEVEVTIIVNKQTAKGDPEVQPALPEFTGGVKGDPEVQPVLPEFAGGVKGDPEVQPALPEFAGGVKGDPEVQPALPEFAGGVNGEPEVQPALPEYTGGVNGEPEVQPELPEYTGGVNGEPEVQPELPEYTGGVNGEPEVQPALPEYTGGVNGEPEVQPALPEYTGGANDESEIRSSFRDKTSNVATKRLANTGQSQNNSELAGFGLAIVGLFAAIKRRKNEEE